MNTSKTLQRVCKVLTANQCSTNKYMLGSKGVIRVGLSSRLRKVGKDNWLWGLQTRGTLFFYLPYYGNLSKGAL